MLTSFVQNGVPYVSANATEVEHNEASETLYVTLECGHRMSASTGPLTRRGILRIPNVWVCPDCSREAQYLEAARTVLA